MKGAAMERMEVVFVGRVQGVGFRATVQGIASSWPVTGWVRNRDDGSVSMAAEGDKASLDGFLKSIQQTMRSNIDQTIVQVQPPRGEKGFRIVG
jgi:acylphosphatase